MEAEPIRWRRIFAILVVLVCVVELVSQAFTFLWAEHRYDSFSKYRWSPYGLVRNNPALTMPGYTINENGFRDLADYSEVKPPNTIRILMVGGSVLYSPLAGKMVSGVERVDSSSTIAQFLQQEMSSDPAFSGVRVEVLNAAVNFSRIQEVSAGYIYEYSNWDPDLVIVFGSGNNFGNYSPKGAVERRAFGFQTPHPWRLEFERVANEHTFASFLGHSLAHVESELSSVAWAHKLGSALIDKLFDFSAKHDFSRRPVPSSEPSTLEEYDRYIAEYLGYADAMIAVARRRAQPIAFFWEYYLAHLKGVKTFSAGEEELFARLRTKRTPQDAAFCLHARDSIGAYLHTQNVPFVDPIETLQRESRTVFSDHIHYTSDGNHLIAKALYRQLRSLLKPAR